MTEKLAILQGEAERAAGRTLVPVLVSGAAMDFRVWRDAPLYIASLLDSPGRPIVGSAGDPDLDTIRDDEAKWAELWERHKNDLFLSFCVARAKPNAVTVASPALLIGPLALDQLGQFIGTTRIRAQRGVPNEVISTYVSEIVSIDPPEAPGFGQSFRRWFVFVAGMVAIIAVFRTLFLALFDDVDVSLDLLWILPGLTILLTLIFATLYLSPYL